jgi:hypothetical protein
VGVSIRYFIFKLQGIKPMFKKLSAVAVAAVAVVAVAAVSGSAFAAGPDMTALTSAVDASTIVVAIGAVAAIKILPGVARWGYNQVMRLFN